MSSFVDKVSRTVNDALFGDQQDAEEHGKNTLGRITDTSVPGEFPTENTESIPRQADMDTAGLTGTSNVASSRTDQHYTTRSRDFHDSGDDTTRSVAPTSTGGDKRVSSSNEMSDVHRPVSCANANDRTTGPAGLAPPQI
jgi:hypothetical protein